MACHSHHKMILTGNPCLDRRPLLLYTHGVSGVILAPQQKKTRLGSEDKVAREQTAASWATLSPFV